MAMHVKPSCNLEDDDVGISHQLATVELVFATSIKGPFHCSEHPVLLFTHSNRHIQNIE